MDSSHLNGFYPSNSCVCACVGRGGPLDALNLIFAKLWNLEFVPQSWGCLTSQWYHLRCALYFICVVFVFLHGGDQTVIPSKESETPSECDCRVKGETRKGRNRKAESATGGITITIMLIQIQITMNMWYTWQFKMHFKTFQECKTAKTLQHWNLFSSVHRPQRPQRRENNLSSR